MMPVLLLRPSPRSTDQVHPGKYSVPVHQSEIGFADSKHLTRTDQCARTCADMECLSLEALCSADSLQPSSCPPIYGLNFLKDHKHSSRLVPTCQAVRY